MVRMQIKRLKTDEDIALMWERKRRYEREDIFPNLSDEDIEWIESQEYYDIIMELHQTAADGGNTLQFVFFFDDTGQYVGLSSYKIYNKEDGKGFILDFYIESSMRGRGVGKAAYGALEDLMRQEGAAYFALNTAGEDARQFWLKMGFVEGEPDEHGDMVYVKR
jgi:GNAT superfamily N-acetyltransferase